MAIYPPSKSDVETVKLYTSLMEEIKIRIHTINTLAGGPTELMPIIVQEICFLQLRLICELIALGCLAAHGDIKATEASKFRKEYSADKILTQLQGLHSDFYPFPTRDITPPGKGGSVIQLELLKDGNFLKKFELLKLYGQTGNHLHRGSMKKLLSPSTPINSSYSEISKWAIKIVDLLEFHTISRLSGNPLVCVMKNTLQAGRVTVQIYGPGPPLTR